MKSTTISLKSDDSSVYIRQFVDLANKFDCDMDLQSGHSIVDAKSIMGVFSLDLNSQITLLVHTSDEELFSQIKDALSNYII